MIPMLQNMDRIQFLTGNKELLQNAKKAPARPTWCDKTVEFLSQFSRNLLKDPKTKGFVDVTSYAFWIRKASLHQIKEHYYSNVDDKMGRGVAFHIAPSNVPVNFAVSFTSSLLAGNISIVRVSNKELEIRSKKLRKSSGMRLKKDLTFKWDGFDMIQNMSRYVYCPHYMER